MRVLQVTTDDDRRGAQVFASDLHAALESLGQVVRTVGLAPGLTGGLDIETLGPSRRNPTTLGALRPLARASDVVFLHGSTTLPVGVLATLGLSVPLVYRQISDPVYWAPSGRRRLQTAFLLRRVDTIITLGRQPERALRDHLRLSNTTIRRIPNGVVTRRFRQPSVSDRESARARFGLGDEFCLSYLGALVPEKGVDVLVRAARQMPDVEVLIGGDGPERPALERMASQNVTFLGSVDQPIEILHASDALTLPSRGGDSMPAVLIEAALAGVPVISTPVGAIPEMINHGCDGIILDRPDPAELVEATRLLHSDDELRTRLGSAARGRALTTYDIGVVAEEWLACARALVTAEPPGVGSSNG